MQQVFKNLEKLSIPGGSGGDELMMASLAAAAATVLLLMTMAGPSPVLGVAIGTSRAPPSARPRMAARHTVYNLSIPRGAMSAAQVGPDAVAFAGGGVTGAPKGSPSSAAVALFNVSTKTWRALHVSARCEWSSAARSTPLRAHRAALYLSPPTFLPAACPARTCSCRMPEPAPRPPAAG